MILTTKENEMSNENTELNNTSTCQPNGYRFTAMLHIQQDFERANSNEYSKEKDTELNYLFSQEANQLAVLMQGAESFRVNVKSGVWLH